MRFVLSLFVSFYARFSWYGEEVFFSKGQWRRNGIGGKGGGHSGEESSKRRENCGQDILHEMNKELKNKRSGIRYIWLCYIKRFSISGLPPRWHHQQLMPTDFPLLSAVCSVCGAADDKVFSLLPHLKVSVSLISIIYYSQTYPLTDMWSRSVQETKKQATTKINKIKQENISVLCLILV